MKLEAYMKSKNNGFNFLRLLGALFVVYSHSYAIFYGTSSIHKDILMNTTGFTTLGDLGVSIFFIISGLLITMSLANNKTKIKTFIMSRILRVYPAMFVMVLLSLVVFYFISSQDFKSFFTSSDTIKYFLKNNTLIFGVHTNLEGIFQDHYFKSVNGSLWTLPWEVRMYVVVFLIFHIFHKYARAITLFLATTISIYYYYLLTQDTEFIHPSIRFMSLFLLGSTFFYFKDKIRLNKVYFIPIVIVLFLALYFRNHDLFHLFNVFLLPYFIIYIAYSFVFLRGFNNIGDYSYGIYIYSFPIQQIFASTDMSFMTYVLFSCSVIFTMAFLSWHFVEKKALSYKKIIRSRYEN